MSQWSRAAQRPVVAPAVVHDVLRPPGRPLESQVARSLWIPSLAGSRPLARGGSGLLWISRADSSPELEAQRLAGPVATGSGLRTPSGFDFSMVRIHADADAAASARAVAARAYTV